MKNNYVFILDVNGERITTIVDSMINPVGEAALLAQAKEQYPDAAQYIYKADGDDMLDQFISGKIYKDGKMVDAPVIAPTAADIKVAKVADIKAKYNAKFTAYESALIRARLAGNDTAVSKIQAAYKSDLAAMAAEIKEV